MVFVLNQPDSTHKGTSGTLLQFIIYSIASIHAIVHYSSSVLPASFAIQRKISLNLSTRCALLRFLLLNQEFAFSTRSSFVLKTFDILVLLCQRIRGDLRFNKIIKIS